MIGNTHNYLLGAIVMVLAGWLGWHEMKARGADWLPIKHVRIEGAFQYIAKDKIKKVVKNQVNNGLYNADIQIIQQSVLNLPWVAQVAVKRVWPDAIDIKISEQVPVVRWGVSRLLNSDGEIFIPENINKFSHLPLLSGPDGDEKKWLEIMKGLSIALNDRALILEEFSVNKRRAWSLKLRNGMELLLGRNEPLNKFQRFLKTFTLIGKVQLATVEVVDLRYPNGYALTWKKGEKNIDWKKIAESRKS